MKHMTIFLFDKFVLLYAHSIHIHKDTHTHTHAKSIYVRVDITNYAYVVHAQLLKIPLQYFNHEIH